MSDNHPREDIRAVAEDARRMLARADSEGAATVWSRLLEQEPQCGYCALGVSCRICSMGPCRVNPFGGTPQRGVCGAGADLIVARNLGRSIAAGAASHSDHARDILDRFDAAGRPGNDALSLRDVPKLLTLAREVGIAVDSRPATKVAEDLAAALFADFGTRQDQLTFLRRAPPKRRALWARLGITPRGLDREPAEMLHRTHMGVDSDPVSLLLHALRTALSDGWGGSMVASELSDVLLGTPSPTRSLVNLGTLRADAVNIALHGHNPLVCELLVEAAQDPALLELAAARGARGINLVGLCCTGAEVLGRHGIPNAGNHLMQELIIMTGALEAMVVDYQCVMPSIADLARCFHTAIVSTSNKARIPGGVHVPLEPSQEREGARHIVALAIAQYAKRDTRRVQIPTRPVPLFAGYSVEALLNILGGGPEALASALSLGQLRGIAAVIGCNNPKVPLDRGHVELTRHLLEQDVLVLTTGCAAIALGKAGLLTPEAAVAAGPGLRSFCEQFGLPPVLHFGSCADNARILSLVALLANHLDVDLSDLPIAAAAPEWYSEKALTIAAYAVASGIFTVVGIEPPIAGSRAVVQLLKHDLTNLTGARLAVAPQPEQAAQLISDHLDAKRTVLGIPSIPRARVRSALAPARAAIAPSV